MEAILEDGIVCTTKQHQVWQNKNEYIKQSQQLKHGNHMTTISPVHYTLTFIQSEIKKDKWIDTHTPPTYVCLCNFLWDFFCHMSDPFSLISDQKLVLGG